MSAVTANPVTHHRNLARFAWFAVFYNVLVILWGALVRASGSGAGCGNRWPLCNGQVIPVSPGAHTIIELIHREMTAGSLLVVLALMIWTLCVSAKGWTSFYKLARITLLTWIFVAFLVWIFIEATEPGLQLTDQGRGTIAIFTWLFVALPIWVVIVWIFDVKIRGPVACAFAITSTLLLYNEALLGALLVKLGYVTGNQSAGRMVVLSIHLSNTLLLLAALTLTARFISTGQRWAGLHRAPGFGWALAGLAATIGVGVSGSMAALGDTLFPAASLQAAYLQDFAGNSPWLLRLRLVHPASALLAALFVIWLIGRSRQAGPHRLPEQEPSRTFLARLVVLLLVLQFVLGIADVLLLAPAWMQLVHLLGADLYWVALVLLAAETIWPVAAVYAPDPLPAHTSVA